MFFFLFLVGEWIDDAIGEPMQSDSEPLPPLQLSHTGRIRNNIWNRNCFSMENSRPSQRQSVCYSVIFGIFSINCILFSVIFDFNIYILYCLFLVNDFNGFNDGTPSGTNRSFNRISKSNNIQINFLNEGAIDNYLFYMRDRNA